MRIFTASAVIAALSLGAPALIRAQESPSQSEPQTPADQSRTVIRSIAIVDVKDLKPVARSQVDDIVAHTSEDNMQSLRKSIDASPAVVSALTARGFSSSQVVAFNVADGILTMFTKTT
jgi:hypothetical protein